MGVIEPGEGGGGIGWKPVWGVGVFRELDEEWRAVEDLTGAEQKFGGGGTGDDWEQGVGLVGLEDGGAEQSEPPWFEVQPLREA